MNEDPKEPVAASDRPQDINFASLVERLVPLVAELFATLSSRNPLRMHFADIANKTLLDMVEVLRHDGISQEAIAASLGLTINGFRSKMKTLRLRYREGGGDLVDDSYAPKTLLERVYAYIDETAGARGVPGAALSAQFRGVKADSLNGVLHFLVKSGLLSVSGEGRSRVYRVVNRPVAGPGFVDAMVMLFREGPMTLFHLAQRLGLPPSTCAEFIERLKDADRIEETIGADGTVRYRVTEYYVPVDATEGYEAALFDHMSAVVGAICRKVRGGVHRATMRDQNGGATFSFDVREDDPLFPEIAGFLERMRAQLDSWHERATAAQEAEAGGEARSGTRRRITIYLGQMVEDLE
ncbi:MAG: winged helix-turn-helix domain-containing protein [Deltaproteobacteria bacterium]|nr:winged helix-turn-helix domain-containing protein [Deltaproteobacteria bacterium]